MKTLISILISLFVCSSAFAQVTFLEVNHPEPKWSKQSFESGGEGCVSILNENDPDYLNTFSLIILNSPDREHKVEAPEGCVPNQMVAYQMTETADGGLQFEAVPGPGQTVDTPTWLDFQIDREVFLRAYNVDPTIGGDVKGTAMGFLQIRLIDTEVNRVIFDQYFQDVNAIQDEELDYFPPPGHALIDPVPETYHVFTNFTENPRNWRLPMKAGSKFKLYVKEYQQLSTGVIQPTE